MANQYRGYPYTQSVVTQAPSLNSEQIAELAKWSHLPVRKVTTKEPAPVVYVDLSEDAGVQATPSCTSSHRDEEDELPVIYIDLPENTSSGVSQPTPDDEPEYVQDTILYDQFKDERITLPQGQSADPQPGSSRPRPPDSLDIASPGSSSGYSSHYSVPSFLSKEAQVYQTRPDQYTPDDGLRLSPLPVSDYPYPPPSYEEVERTQEAPSPVHVITGPSNGVYPTPAQNEDRKFLHCHHCRSQVHSLVIKENGPLTHIFAWMFMLMCLFPLTALLYMTSICKYRYHYCPNCNKKIAFEIPLICTGMTYIND